MLVELYHSLLFVFDERLFCVVTLFLLGYLLGTNSINWKFIKLQMNLLLIGRLHFLSASVTSFTLITQSPNLPSMVHSTLIVESSGFIFIDVFIAPKAYIF